jgi:hypothetical protein
LDRNAGECKSTEAHRLKFNKRIQSLHLLIKFRSSPVKKEWW